jgi:hypothetical protein
MLCTWHVVVACHHGWLHKVSRTIQALSPGENLPSLAHYILNTLFAP